MSKQNNIDYFTSSIMILVLVIIIFNVNVLDATIGFIPILDSIKKGQEIVIGRSSPIVLCQLIWSMGVEIIISKVNKGSDKVLYKISEKIVISSVSVLISSFLIIMVSTTLVLKLHIPFLYVGPVLLLLTIALIFITIKVSGTSKEVLIKLFFSVVVYLASLQMIPDVDVFAKTLLISFVPICVSLLGIYIMSKTIFK